MDTSRNQDTHFGFRTVKEAEKAPLVQELFTSVAGKYDLMNDALSFGAHRLWKDALLAKLQPKLGHRYLDVAGGTGDIAFRIHDYLQSSQAKLAPRFHEASRKDYDQARFEAASQSQILVCDITEAMLVEGRHRAEAKAQAEAFNWMTGDAMSLALPDRSVDAYTIAFGLRNVVRPAEALEEALRVLKPGGRFFCLEFSKVVLPLFDKLYDTYSFEFMPRVGRWLAGDSDSYQYLAESIRQFPSQEVLATMMRDAGFDLVTYQNMSGGIVALHSGWKL